jgi:hypothetical protein
LPNGHMLALEKRSVTSCADARSSEMPFDPWRQLMARPTTYRLTMASVALTLGFVLVEAGVRRRMTLGRACLAVLLVGQILGMYTYRPQKEA